MSQDMDAGWDATTDRLRRTFRFGGFSEAWAFMSRVALAAEQQDHHPDWSNSYNRVIIELTSHDKGRTVTDRDRRLAATIDQIYAGSPSDDQLPAPPVRSPE